MIDFFGFEYGVIDPDAIDRLPWTMLPEMKRLATLRRLEQFQQTITAAQLPAPMWTPRELREPFKAQEIIGREIERIKARRTTAEEHEDRTWAVQQWLKKNPWAHITEDALGKL